MEPSVAEREVFDVTLTKGACGFGIYFAAGADGTAIVDPSKPFYRMPDESLAPGEASQMIAPSDRLLAINAKAVDKWRFQDVVEELRGTPLGDTTLRFERRLCMDETKRSAQESTHKAPSTPDTELKAQFKVGGWKLPDWQAALKIAIASSSATPSHEDVMNRSAAMEELLLDMESRIRSLEQDLEREKKCRFLAEKKNILYRNALASLSEENSQLRHKLALDSHNRAVGDAFQQRLHLSV